LGRINRDIEWVRVNKNRSELKVRKRGVFEEYY
jgi:hypothetical protein